MSVDKVFYNQASAAKLGWEPSWFGCEHNDEQLVVAIRKWQRKSKIASDGMCGPSTYRRIWTERQADIHDYAPAPSRQCGVGQKHIVHNSKFLPIEWDKVVLWNEEDGQQCDKGNYYDYSGKPDRKPTNFTSNTNKQEKKKKVGDLTKEFIENSKEDLKNEKKELDSSR